MLEKKDLRVGNWVEFKKPSGFDYCRLTKSSFEGNYISNNFKAIKIDKRWVTDFGFEKVFFKEGFYLFENFAVHINDGVYWLLNSENENRLIIKYVHELQNAFFDLNRTDLDFRQ